MLGINFSEFLVLGLIALIVLGPERLPQYAAQLGKFVKDMRRMASGAREQVRSELGPEFDDIDWQKLDPRQYDPRRIVREALQEAWDDEPSPAAGRRDKPAVRPDPAGGHTRRPGDAEGPAPFDGEAT